MKEPKNLEKRNPKEMKMKLTKSKKNKGEEKNRSSLFGQIKQETRQGILAVVFFLLSILTVLASLNYAGLVGTKIYSSLSYLFGDGYYLMPVMFLLLGISFLRAEKRNFTTLKSIGGFLFFISGLGIIDLAWEKHGGLIGWLISSPMLKLFDFWAGLIILVTVLIISSLILFETSFTVNTLFFWRRWSNKEDDEDEDYDIEEEEIEEEEPAKISEAETLPGKDEEDEKPKENKIRKAVEKIIGLEEEEIEVTKPMPVFNNRPYIPPPLSLLEKDKGKPGVGDIKANANIIKRTLQNFGIDVEMDEISIGPSITRYALKPAEGVKLSRIVGLQNDLSLALAAHPLRIEAPIPGKSLVGIEIPNQSKTMVGMATLFSSDEFRTSEKPLLVALGKGVSGKSHFANIAKMPHCLIAGTTGSGKSVTIHTIINSLLFRNSPEAMKFIMIDPKRVELTLYNKIPHLLTPVITDAKKTILALKWAAKEMDRRYDILEAESCKDIDSYHKNIYAPEIEKLAKMQEAGTLDPIKNVPPEAMPYIIIVIDELADIMMTYPRELEAGIVRLAQMSRAVGIHLIVSTQRPSVNVITGLIKANIPSRIALQVASQIDSRTILDGPGAEKLLGAGDMLYLGGEMSKPVRIQSAFISEGEVKSVVKYLSSAYKDEVPSGIDLAQAGKDSNNSLFSAVLGDGNPEDEDDMYEQAKEEVIKAGKASTSYIQRKLRVGYSRAARLMDILEEQGVIGPGDGAKPREILMSSNNERTGEIESMEKLINKKDIGLKIKEEDEEEEEDEEPTKISEAETLPDKEIEEDEVVNEEEEEQEEIEEVVKIKKPKKEEVDEEESSGGGQYL
ncbi:MAG: DNA translocase FtsK 4TM domain-containing protein [Minisyncoccia bacterium]